MLQKAYPFDAKKVYLWGHLRIIINYCLVLEKALHHLHHLLFIRVMMGFAATHTLVPVFALILIEFRVPDPKLY